MGDADWDEEAQEGGGRGGLISIPPSLSLSLARCKVLARALVEHSVAVVVADIARVLVYFFV